MRIGRLTTESRKAALVMSKEESTAAAAAAADHSSIADTASVRSDDAQHDTLPVSASGPLERDLTAHDDTEEDACELCGPDCCAPPPKGGKDGERYYTPCQVRRHNTRESAWLVAGDNIYDATPYLATHPGGAESILRRAGGATDATRDLEFHSGKGKRMFQRYRIGKVRPCGTHQNGPNNSGKQNKPFWALW